MKSSESLNRRTLLKAGALSAASLLLPQRALASLDFPALYPERNLSLINSHTGERLKTVYFKDGGYQPEALIKIDHIMRDRFTDEVGAIDVSLLDLLHSLSTALPVEAPFHIISGYRTPESNDKLRQKNKGVAKKSYHLLGKAIDIRIPGLHTAHLRDAALKLKGGGVGFYSRSDFVHLDVGPVRNW